MSKHEEVHRVRISAADDEDIDYNNLVVVNHVTEAPSHEKNDHIGRRRFILVKAFNATKLKHAT